MDFAREVQGRLGENARNRPLQQSSAEFLQHSLRAQYSYNFSWMSRPIIQYPQDIVALQELIWRNRPDLILETGIGHGGSLILSASMLALLDYPERTHRRVLAVDIDLRQHNRRALVEHPLGHLIQTVDGSSVEPQTVELVHQLAQEFPTRMLILDSNHTHQHVLQELEAYAPLVTPGQYLVVFDGLIENSPPDMFPDRPWGPGDNPLTATREFLKTHPEFEIDQELENKLLISAAPSGYLKRL